MNTRLLLRLAKIARRPPSKKQQIFIATILGICALLFAIDYVLGWPEWLTPDNRRPKF